MKNFDIPIPFSNNKPDLKIQQDVVNYLDSCIEKINALRIIQTEEIHKMAEFRGSILNKAFNGDFN